MSNISKNITVSATELKFYRGNFPRVAFNHDGKEAVSLAPDGEEHPIMELLLASKKPEELTFEFSVNERKEDGRLYADPVFNFQQVIELAKLDARKRENNRSNRSEPQVRVF